MSPEYQDALDRLLALSPYGLTAQEKATHLLPIFTQLHRHHLAHCSEYRRICDMEGEGKEPQQLEDLPYIAVRLFKQHSLKSIADGEIFKMLTSSGTTGQAPARIFLDRHTSARQSKMLVHIMRDFLGPKRLPMLIVDSPDVLKKPTLSARAAGVQGMAFFGRDHTYGLNQDMSVNQQAIQAFAEKYAGQPVLIFGFTFMVWRHFVQAIEKEKIPLSLPFGILVHSGGWKKLADQQVDNVTFKRTLGELTGIQQIHNFYGMAEQVGSVFVECRSGHLHAPACADIVIRCPYTLDALPHGQMGLIQVLSILPTSYPGFSLLTEDMGRVLGEDDCECGRKGRYFSLQGRLPKTEVRGCSDTGGKL